MKECYDDQHRTCVFHLGNDRRRVVDAFDFETIGLKLGRFPSKCDTTWWLLSGDWAVF